MYCTVIKPWANLQLPNWRQYLRVGSHRVRLASYHYVVWIIRAPLEVPNI